MDFYKTPSFYNNEDYFNKYLGKTSYYIGLQKVTDKIISLITPTKVLEMGSALGTTTSFLASKYPSITFVGTDIREDVVKQANSISTNTDNVSFFTANMCDLATKSLEEYDLIYLLYSFHHIIDPLENKIEFLKNCYKNMKTGSYLLITETFLPEEITSLKEDQAILNLFKYRSIEGYASTYWEALSGLDKNSLQFATEVAEFSKHEESIAGENVYHRIDEYLINFSWLVDEAKSCGFEIIIAEPVNSVMEKALLLRK